MNHYDLIIVGGGMVGLALAAKLATTKLNIAVIDPSPVQSEWNTSEYDLRVSAITRATEQLLQQIGAWQAIAEQEKSAYQKMQVWDGESSSGKINFEAKLIAEQNLGHIIENRVLRRSIYSSIAHSPKVKFFFSEKCSTVDYQEDKAFIRLESGVELSANLLVAADGAFSWLRQESEIDIKQKPFAHRAIVCTVKTSQAHQATAYQRFSHQGPLALLPLPDENYCSVVWSLDEEPAKRMMALDDEQFAKSISQTFEQLLGDMELVSRRIAFPLIERNVESLIGPRLAIVGDAAHTIHPLAGQGVNLGFADVLQLAKVLEQALDKNKDIGSLASLRPYERARKGEIFVMQQAMRGFKNLFASQTPILQMARSYGLQQVDKHLLIKQQLIKKAIGL